MKYLALLASLLLTSGAALAQTYTNANLSGNYSYQTSNPQLYSWSKSFTCPTNTAITYTAVGSTTTQQVTYGTGTFDGIGTVTTTQTTVGIFNPTASANTTSVTWNSSCQVTKVNNGHVVYANSTTNTSTSTYSVQSNGSGTITSSGGTLTILLAGTNSSGISTTILLTGKQVNGQTIGSGIAIHQ